MCLHIRGGGESILSMHATCVNYIYSAYYEGRIYKYQNSFPLKKIKNNLNKTHKFGKPYFSRRGGGGVLSWGCFSRMCFREKWYFPQEYFPGVFPGGFSRQGRGIFRGWVFSGGNFLCGIIFPVVIFCGGKYVPPNTKVWFIMSQNWRKKVWLIDYYLYKDYKLSVAVFFFLLFFLEVYSIGCSWFLFYGIKISNYIKYLNLNQHIESWYTRKSLKKRSNKICIFLNYLLSSFLLHPVLKERK